MTIDHLPTFTVSQLEHDRAIGTFDRPLWIGERHLGDLLLPDERFVSGRFIDVDFQALTVTFIPAAAEDVSALKADTTYPRLDRYWGKRAALVLDRERRWSQRTFEPVDALAFNRAGEIRKATNQKVAVGGTLIKGGWDHEHCDICWGTISPKTDTVAMFSEPDHWICRRCYERFVVPRSLDFIDGENCGHYAGEE